MRTPVGITPDTNKSKIANRLQFKGDAVMSNAPAPIQVFCSYAQQDEKWLRKLETHLSLLKHQGLIATWHNRLVLLGTNWTQDVDSHLHSASIILLLISADFLASDYCYGSEMKRALERESLNEAYVIPILVRPVDWKKAPFAHLKVLPTDAKPITRWSNQDEAYTNVVQGIRAVLENLQHSTFGPLFSSMSSAKRPST